MPLCTFTPMFRHLFLMAAIFGQVVTALRDDPRCRALKAANPTLCEQGFRPPSDLTTPHNDSAPPLRCIPNTPLWQDRLTELGVGQATRTIQPTLTINNWLSAEMPDSIAYILMKEAMGIDVKTEGMAINGNTEILCCDQFYIELEKWNTGHLVDDDGYFSMQKGKIGYDGASGLFVPGYTVEAYPLATAHLAYKVLENYSHVFPPGMSTNCTRLIVDQALGCVEGNYICDKGPATGRWTNTTCTQGRYVPPQCQADPTKCQEIYLADPTWDAGYFEALIKNTGLPFVVAYLGYGGMFSMLAEKAVNKEHVMFYWWKPDTLVASVGAKAVNFEGSSFECEQSANTDPTLSGVDCMYPSFALAKWARRDELANDPDFKFFYESMTLKASELDVMLAKHTSAGGTDNVYNMTCTWVLENYGTWKDWVKNTPSAASASAQKSNLATIIGVGVGVPVVVIALAALFMIFFIRKQHAESVKNAPTETPLVLIFTDIESSTMLWEQYGDKMAAATEIHHKIVREVIEEFKAYEVKTIGDAFMIAVSNLIDATLLCLEIQTRLNEAEWPAELLYWKGSAEPKGKLMEVGLETSDVWRGLRVRMGMHCCMEVEPKYDSVHKRYDYYGPDVNVSARVQSVAQGGQITCSAETFRKLSDDPDFDSISGDFSSKLVSQGVTLKGVADPVPLFQLLPLSLSDRTFEPIEGAAEDTEGYHTGGDTETASRASSLWSQVGPRKDIGFAIDVVLESFPDRKSKNVFLCQVAKHLNLEVEQMPYPRRLRAIKKALSPADDVCSHGSQRMEPHMLSVGENENPLNKSGKSLGTSHRHRSTSLHPDAPPRAQDQNEGEHPSAAPGYVRTPET